MKHQRPVLLRELAQHAGRAVGHIDPSQVHVYLLIGMARAGATHVPARVRACADYGQKKPSAFGE